jgi:hypothetical protein
MSPRRKYWILNPTNTSHPPPFNSISFPLTRAQASMAQQFVNSVYYPSWQIYKGCPPSALQHQFITHIFYAFARYTILLKSKQQLCVIFANLSFFFIHSVNTDGTLRVGVRSKNTFLVNLLKLITDESNSFSIPKPISNFLWMANQVVSPHYPN